MSPPPGTPPFPNIHIPLPHPSFTYSSILSIHLTNDLTATPLPTYQSLIHPLHKITILHYHLSKSSQLMGFAHSTTPNSTPLALTLVHLYNSSLPILEVSMWCNTHHIISSNDSLLLHIYLPVVTHSMSIFQRHWSRFLISLFTSRLTLLPLKIISTDPTACLPFTALFLASPSMHPLKYNCSQILHYTGQSFLL